MRRYSRLNTARFGAIPALLGIIAAALAPIPAQADAVGYASARRQIKAGVLVSNAALSGNVPQNTDPYVFYVLDQRTDLKPAGWEFVNPLAPQSITPEMVTRWQSRVLNGFTDPAFTAGTAESVIFRAGAPLTKNIGAYWEVNLDTVSDASLQQFDILLLAYNNVRVSFTTEELRKLRQYVDSGGTIWLEDEGGMDILPPQNATEPNLTTGYFLTPLVFEFTFSNNNAPPTAYAPSHPLITFPYTLTSPEVTRLGIGAANNRHPHTAPGAGFPGADGTILVPILWQGATGGTRPLLSAGSYGAGHLIVSSLGSATDINSYVGGSNAGQGGNSGAVSGTAFQAALPADLKLAYNIIDWISSVGSPRGMIASREDLGSQLGPKWTVVPPVPGSFNTNLGSGATLHKNIAYYVDGTNILHAYDAHPQESLNNTQNPDDGIPDYFSKSSPYDEIWNANLGIGSARVSTPTLFSIFGRLPGDSRPIRPLDILALTTSTGVTMAFDGAPRDPSTGLLSPNGSLIWTAQSPTGGVGDLSASLNSLGGVVYPGGAAAGGGPVPGPSPVYSEGVLFTAVYDPTSATDATPWHIQPLYPNTGINMFGITRGVAPTPARGVAGLPDIVGPLTVAYIRDAATNALDKIVYAPTHVASSALGSPIVDSISGMWFSTRDEPLIAIDPNNQTFKPTGLRARVLWWAPSAKRGQANTSLYPVLHVVHADGSVTTLHYYNGPNTSGDFNISYTGTAPNQEINVLLNTAVLPTDKVYADYTIDWPGDDIAGTVPSQQEEQLFYASRGFQTYNPTTGVITGPSQSVIGPPVISSSNEVLFNIHDTRVGMADRVYAVHDQYPLNPTSPQGQAGQPGTTVDWMFSPVNGGTYGTDTLPPRLVSTDATGPGATAGTITNFRAIGSPVVSNNTVYVLGQGSLGSLAGQKVTVLLALKTNFSTSFTIKTQVTDPNVTVTLRQVNIGTSTSGNPPTYTTLTEGQNFTFDRVSGTITITDFRQNGQDAFNTALPFDVFTTNGISETVTNPTTGFGPLDNLLWFMVIPSGRGGVNRITNPRQYSDLTPTSGPSLIGNSLYYAAGYQVVSIDLPTGNVSGGQYTLYDTKQSPPAIRVHWQSTLTDPSTGKFLVSGAPINPGLTVSATGMMISPPVGGTDTVVLGTPQGIAALDNGVTLIADLGRLLEVDYGVNAVWSVDSTKDYLTTGGTLTSGSGSVSATKVSLTNPTVARRTSLSEFIVADTGNNRVIQMDRGGNVIWELRSFFDDMHFLRPGDPITLNAPTDVQTYTEAGTGFSVTSPNQVTYANPGAYYAVHYVVADSGNYRAIEVVDAYDANGRPLVLAGSDGSSVTMQHQLVYVTQSLAEQNAHYRYRTVQEFLDPNTKDTNGNPVTFVISAIDNMRIPALDPGTQITGFNSSNTAGPGGSLVFLNRNAGSATAVIVNSIVITDRNGNIVKRQAVANPTWFKEFDVADATAPSGIAPRYLLADSNGCYVLRPTVINGVSEAVVEWMLSSDAYAAMTGRPLRAVSIQRLSQADYDLATNKFYPHYLITNSYVGRDSSLNFGLARNEEVHGEVFEIRSIDYYKFTNSNNVYDGYDPTVAGAGVLLYNKNINTSQLQVNLDGPIAWMVPKETIDATGRLRRSIGSPNGPLSTSVLNQPAFSDRAF